MLVILRIECRNWAMSISLVCFTVLQLQGFLHLQSHRQAGEAAEFSWPPMYDTACRWCNHFSKCVFVSLALIWACGSQPMGPRALPLFIYAGANTTLESRACQFHSWLIPPMNTHVSCIMAFRHWLKIANKSYVAPYKFHHIGDYNVRYMIGHCSVWARLLENLKFWKFDTDKGCGRTISFGRVWQGQLWRQRSWIRPKLPTLPLTR